MILFPAIDLKGGQCVRLLKGDMRQATVFNDNPAAQARAFEAQGFRWLVLGPHDGAVMAAAQRRVDAGTATVVATFPPLTIVRLGGD